MREQLVVVQQAGEEQAAAAAAEEEEEVAEEEASAAQQAEQEQYLHLADAFESGRPVPLPFEQVRAWTQGFSTEVRIGEGSFGEVFQGLVKLDARANANVDIDGVVATCGGEKADHGASQHTTGPIQCYRHAEY